MYIIFKFSKCIQFSPKIFKTCPNWNSPKFLRQLETYSNKKFILIFIPAMKYLHLAYKDPTWRYFYLSQMKNIVEGPVRFSRLPSCFDYNSTCQLGHITRQLKYLTCLPWCTLIFKNLNHTSFLYQAKSYKIEWNNQHTEYITTFSQESSFLSRKSKTK